MFRSNLINGKEASQRATRSAKGKREFVKDTFVVIAAFSLLEFHCTLSLGLIMQYIFYVSVISLLLVRSTFYNPSVINDMFFKSQWCSGCQCAIIIPRYVRKYLCRIIPHASNGSFNPYIITNKDAHIIYGNIFSSDKVHLKKKQATSPMNTLSTTSRTSQLICSGRHLMNYCLNHSGKFSCAVDCFLELSCALFLSFLQSINRTPFFETLYQSCLLLKNSNLHTDLELVREPVWAKIECLPMVETCAEDTCDDVPEDVNVTTQH